MTRRALFWCGFVRPPPGRFAEPGASDAAYADAVTFSNDLELAVDAARALGVEDRHMVAFVCDGGLLPAGYSGERRVPTIAALEQLTTRLAKTATADDAILFFATNHGVPQGLLTSARVDELDLEPGEASFLTPEVLARALDDLPGVQALVIAVCHAGIFLPLARLDRRLVLAACDASAIYYGGGSVAWAGFPAELFRAWAGISLVMGGDRPTRVDLDAAFDLARQSVMEGKAGRVIEPHRAGSIQWPR